MSDQRHVFTILEDNSTGAGVKLPARQEGDVLGGNHVPALVAKDVNGNYKAIEAREEGASSAINALPSFVAKDPSGNLAYLRLNAEGEVIFSNDGASIKVFEYAKVTPAAINTLTTVVDLTLLVDEIYEKPAIRVSSFHPCMWELVQVNDVTLTVLDSMLTGPGQFTFNINYAALELTAGSSGTQALRIRATQLSGPASDMHGYVEAFQKA